MLIVVSGLPGTGKSTVAAALAGHINAVHLSVDDAEDALLGAGLPPGFRTGVAAYEAVRAAAKVVPLDRLLVETDSPYLAPVPMRGKRNEPAFVAHTGAVLAGVVGVSVGDLAAATTANARRLFGLPAHDGPGH